MSKSIAVAYSMKKKKKASGGSVESGDVTMNLSKGGEAKMPFPKRSSNKSSPHAKGVHKSRLEQFEPGESDAGYSVGAKDYKHAKEDAKVALEAQRKIKGPTSGKSGFAQGGEVSEGDPAWACSECGSHSLTFMGHQDSSHEMDMIGKALEKRRMAHGGRTCAPGDIGGSPMYSKGGQVANDEGQGVAADELPNEFDDLVLDDDAEMKGYTENNSGDDIGGPSKSDVVSKAMLKRKKK